MSRAQDLQLAEMEAKEQARKEGVEQKEEVAKAGQLEPAPDKGKMPVCTWTGSQAFIYIKLV